MKKSVLLFLFSFSTVVTSFAQLSIGGRLGVGLPTITGDENSTAPTYTRGSNLGILGGLNFNLKIDKNLSFQPELLFIQGGYTMNQDIAGSIAKSSVNHNYIQVPVLFKGSFGGESFKINVHAGPTLGFTIDGNRTTTYLGKETVTHLFKDEQYVKEFNKQGIAPFDFGVLVGIGGELKLGQGTAFLDIRSNFGLSDISNPGTEPIKRNLIPYVSFGYMFTFASKEPTPAPADSTTPTTAP
jgi:hypothetical protein